MLAVEVSKFEADDFKDAMRHGVSRRALAIFLTIAGVPIGFISIGGGVLVARYGFQALLAMVPAVISWMFLGLLIKNFLRPTMTTDTEPEQHFRTLLAPMRIVFEEETGRVRVEMPIGHSSLDCHLFDRWRESAQTFSLVLKDGGAFIIPRRYTDPVTVNAMEAFFRTRGVRVQSLTA